MSSGYTRQLQVLETSKILRDKASMAQSAWNRYVNTRRSQDGRIAYEKFQDLEGQIWEANLTLNKIEESELDKIQDLSDLDEDLEEFNERPYQAIRALENNLNPWELDEDRIYTECLETAAVHSEKLYTKILSSPMYRDIEADINTREQRDFRTSLESDMVDTHKELDWYNSLIEEVADRADHDNIEAAMEHIEEYAENGANLYKKGIGLLSDLRRYRSENGLEERSNIENTVEGIGKNPEEIHRKGYVMPVNVTAEKLLSESMEEFFDWSQKLDGGGPLAQLDDSEIIE